jgi:hypothetical protein
MSLVTSDLAGLLALGSFAIASISFIYQHFKTNADTQSRITAIETKLGDKKDYVNDIQEMLQRIKALEVKNELVWGAVEKAVVDILHHPNMFERDSLLEKLRDKTINLDELEKLDNMLRCSLIEDKGKNESVASALLIARIRQILFDSGKLEFISNNHNK